MTAATSTMPVLDNTTNQAAVDATEKKAKKPIRQVSIFQVQQLVTPKILIFSFFF